MNNNYKLVNGKELRRGYTTGSTAAAAATAGTEMFLTGEIVPRAKIKLPDGSTAFFDVENVNITKEYVVCSVTKDGGDDPDATSGLKIFAKVEKYVERAEDSFVFVNTDKIIDIGNSHGENDDESIENLKIDPDSKLPVPKKIMGNKVIIARGEGVGISTKPGLAPRVGEPAINPTPRRMIILNTESVIDKYKFNDKLLITISIPKGQEVAKKTFNPRLGIIGGLSILGTTGIVEPMSEKALIDTIHVDINSCFAEDPDLILIAPGNYGRAFCIENLGMDIQYSAEISNYVGEALDYIKYKGFKRVLFVGHTGKLIKLAAGIMNTHSSYADGRMEIIAAHSGALGANPKIIEKILSATTTDEAFNLIKEEKYYEELKQRILNKALQHLRFRLKDEVEIEIVMFTTKGNEIIKSEGADRFISDYKKRRTK